MAVSKKLLHNSTFISKSKQKIQFKDDEKPFPWFSVPLSIFIFFYLVVKETKKKSDVLGGRPTT